MKLRSISDSKRAQWHSNSKPPRRNLETSEGSRSNAAAVEGPERRKFQQRWQTPDGLLSTSREVASHAARYLRRWQRSSSGSVLDELVDDASSLIVVNYFALTEFDRPQTIEQFRQFCWPLASRFMSGECRKYSLEHGGDDSVRAHMEKESIEGNGDVLDNIDWLRGAQSSPQFTHVYARQSLERLMQLPPSMSRIALKIADGASLVEASKEMSLDIL